VKPSLEQTVTVDFETVVEPGYSLQRLSTRQYVDDPRFFILGVAIAVGDGRVRFFFAGARRPGDSLEAALQILRAQRDAGATLVAHNAHFEGMILDRSFGLHFTRTFDTAAYARALGIGASLASFARWLGHEKLEAPPFDRNTLRDPALLEKMARYCMTDVALCRKGFVHALDNASFPDVEFDVINHTTQVNLRGVRLGEEQVATLLQTLRGRRDAELETFARTYRFDTSDINKSKRVLGFIRDHFGTSMRSLDRKKDEFANAITRGGDLADFLMSRARLQALSKGVGKAAAYAAIPSGRVYGILRYYGAHTGRFSAGGRDAEKLNLHGLGKGNELLALPELGLERTVVIPEDGQVFCAADLSAIEARVVAFLAGETELLYRFRSGSEVYSWFAGLIFPDVVIDKAGPNRHLRKLGKEAVLGLGFGMGLPTFIRQVRAKQIPCELADIERAYATYRASFTRIMALRLELIKAFDRARVGWPVEGTFWKMRCAESEGASAPTVALDLPTGRTLYYRSVRVSRELTERGYRPALWFAPGFGGKGKAAAASHAAKRRKFEDGVVRDRLTPQVLVENLVQAVARDVMVHQMLELEAIGLPAVWHTHDEVVVTCPACACADGACTDACPWTQAVAVLKEVMSQVPSTLPRLSDLPVACDDKPAVRRTYSE